MLYLVLTCVDVMQINENDMVVSLPSSLTGVVRRREVSDYFHQRAANTSNKHTGRGSGGRGRYFDESSTAGDKPLTDLFHEGQVRKPNEKRKTEHKEYRYVTCISTRSRSHL